MQIGSSVGAFDEQKMLKKVVQGPGSLQLTSSSGLVRSGPETKAGPVDCSTEEQSLE